MTDQGAKDGANGFEQYSNVLDSWREFHERIQTHMKSSLDDQKRLNETFTKKWNETSKDIGEHISKVGKGGKKEYQELNNIWRNYQNKMNARIMKASTIGNNGHSELMDKWNKQSAKMMALLDRMTSGKETEVDEDMRMDLYKSWLDLTNSISTHISNAVKDNSTEYQNLTKTWFEFLDNMKAGISKLQDNTEVYNDMFETLEGMSSKIGTELSNLVTENMKRFKDMQRSWQEQSTALRGDFSKVFKEINYEELYSGFFDRNSMMPWTNLTGSKTVKALEEDVKALRKRVSELEALLKERKK